MDWLVLPNIQKLIMEFWCKCSGITSFIYSQLTILKYCVYVKLQMQILLCVASPPVCTLPVRPSVISSEFGMYSLSSCPCTLDRNAVEQCRRFIFVVALHDVRLSDNFVNVVVLGLLLRSAAVVSTALLLQYQ